MMPPIIIPNCLYLFPVLTKDLVDEPLDVNVVPVAALALEVGVLVDPIPEAWSLEVALKPPPLESAV